MYASNSSGNWEIYTCNSDGSNIKQLTHTSDLDENFPTYSPDGSQIAFCASPKVADNSPGDGYEIYVMNSDGTNVVKLTNNNAMDMSPRWSPDGTRLAFISERLQLDKPEVYVMNVDGSNVIRVTTTPAAASAINPVWKPK